MKTLKSLYIELAKNKYDYLFVGSLIVAECILGLAIIYKVPYTEIDWVAYMQEVDFWLDGEYDYRNIYGNTGPLVYPAGFLYLFGFLQWLTNRNIPEAQIFFLGFYVITQTTVLGLYLMEISLSQHTHEVWSFRIAMCLLCLSKRFHSIFLLRLFNDGPTMLVAYMSFWCFMNNKWNLGCFVFSLAVSLKMNVLLFAPGLLFLLIQTDPKLTIPRLAICGFTQLILGAPFLLRHPVSYLRKAFELDRQFFFKWTVNLKFLSEEIFLSKPVAITLLSLHLCLLGIYHFRLYKLCSRSRQKILSPEQILSTLFVSNFIGICCARTLHYQFYSWYFSAVPYILWRETSYSIPVRLYLFGCIEYAFLVFPATPTSSLVLQVAHWTLLVPTVLIVQPRSTRLVDAILEQKETNNNITYRKDQ
ncbi:putative alpha-1,3 mannosyltransferase [Fragilariopsis cylindrus CCMP1102]|uniref:dolichyl-P-Man:Man5GlcNAc2-PP-dolichol alpha-1,3-mannosyltransferase n=1 Tax=Fragilariopsis cylindrus CCMP1102 TaxID=635003 RepID=A0A1E7FQZ6_9STRA|nr:putative alpha-1,3 mannosyltransferase [Fragilariopsis cylindrus CCMP1102]|eukprot:OEU20525.1 putative alpha-1,3 mannosyltransferase [Fragilariopsis cylindrus CCMP1102]